MKQQTRHYYPDRCMIWSKPALSAKEALQIQLITAAMPRVSSIVSCNLQLSFEWVAHTAKKICGRRKRCALLSCNSKDDGKAWYTHHRLSFTQSRLKHCALSPSSESRCPLMRVDGFAYYLIFSKAKLSRRDVLVINTALALISSTVQHSAEQ